MSDKLNQLKDKLRELFQLDRPDLDFGFYRIMHAKQDEIESFLSKDLLPQVQAGLATLKGDGSSELEEAVKQAKSLGVDPDSVPKVKELKARYSTKTDASQVEDEIYSHLYRFFSRYYDNGDFISMRRYKEGVYAIPYEGEEVVLHWANKDQYYIKSSENLRDYTVKLGEGDNAPRLHFKLVEADIEKDNRKTAADNKRIFIFNSEKTEILKNEIVLGFEYRADPENRKQEAFITACVDYVKEHIADFGSLGTKLLALKPTDKRKDRTLLEKHLTDYTATNSMDYFIHKDLGGFLRRELDFYIKNEVMHLDDIENETAPRVEQYLAQVRVIRGIAHKLIDFLAQLEDFQKKLWLKKKFVVETNWCITLDRVPEELYPEIAINNAQWAEWEKLGFVEPTKPAKAKKKSGELALGDQDLPEPGTIEYLKAFPYMVIDTAFYDEAFKQKLLASIENIDEQTDGLLIHSENFQALQLLQERYREQVKCIYIDPPYNTGTDGFAYKDRYQHSCWATMMQDRVRLAKCTMNNTSGFFTSINDTELTALRSVLSLELEPVNMVTVKTKVAGVSGSHHGKSLRNATEYLLIHAKSTDDFKFTERVHDTQELLEYINEMEEAGKSWKYTSVLNSVDEGEYVKSIRDGSGDEIRLYAHHNVRIQSVSSLAQAKYGGDLRKAYYENIDKVFRTTNAQSSIRVRICEETHEIRSDIISAVYTPKSGRNAGKLIRLYYKDASRNLITFLKDTVVIAENIISKKIASGTLWAEIQYNNLALEGDVAFPNGKKPLILVKKAIDMMVDDNGVVMDFFGGSGTTAHAAIFLNREDNGQRKYILVEMGDYFDTVLKPRIQKVLFSKDWKSGCPTDPKSGISHCFKYLRLESYEDCLNNLELKRTADQDDLLSRNPALKEDYTLRYMLDVESSNSLLNVAAFADPFNYTLKVASGSVGETRPVKVDLVETFNYLIGLKVKTMDVIRDITVVTGESLKGEKILVLWRTVVETNNDALNKWFIKQNYNTQDMEFDIIYVNGDNNLENLRKDEETWKVRLIEEEFLRRMFAGEEV